jgi:hypothetical protein
MTVQELRAQAEKCEELANQTDDPTINRRHEERARQWRDLAAHLDFKNQVVTAIE